MNRLTASQCLKFYFPLRKIRKNRKKVPSPNKIWGLGGINAFRKKAVLFRKIRKKPPLGDIATLFTETHPV